MAKLTYFPLLMDRWVAGTRALTFEQKGFYIDLLVYLYDSGQPIKDADHAARITGCDPRTSRRLLADLSQKFYRRSDGLRHKLVTEILKRGGKIKNLGTFEILTEQQSDPYPYPEPEEKKKNPSDSKKKSVDSQTGKRLTEDWQPTSELVAWAREDCPQVDLHLETDKFRDYWLAKPGQQAKKISWDRTWKNWIRQAAERQPNGGRKRKQPERLPDDYYNPDGSVNERYTEAPERRRSAGLGSSAAAMAGSAAAVARDDAASLGRCGAVVDYDAGAALDAIRATASYESRRK